MTVTSFQEAIRALRDRAVHEAILPPERAHLDEVVPDMIARALEGPLVERWGHGRHPQPEGPLSGSPEDLLVVLDDEDPADAEREAPSAAGLGR